MHRKIFPDACPGHGTLCNGWPEARRVGLSAAKVPAKLVIRPAFRVLFVFDDGLMLLEGDRPFFLEADFRPLLLGEHRSGKPTHVEGEIVDSA